MDIDIILTDVAYCWKDSRSIGFSELNVESNSIGKLVHLIKSKELRDIEDIWTISASANVYSAVYGMLTAITMSKDAELQVALWEAIYSISDFPEFDNKVFMGLLNDEFLVKFIKFQFTHCNKLCSMAIPFNKPDIIAQQTKLHTILIEYSKQFLFYCLVHCTSKRSVILTQLHKSLSENLKYMMLPKKYSVSGNVLCSRYISKQIASVLTVMSSVISGCQSEPLVSAESREHAQPLVGYMHRVLVQLLLPLHLPNDMEEWRDQIPVIQVGSCLCSGMTAY